MSTMRPDGDDDFDTMIDGEWRKASREEPRPHVDAAILAAARTRRPRFATWQPLAAAAAVAGLAFLLVQLLPRERELEQPIRMESQQPAAVPVEQTGAAAKATTQGATEAAPVAPRIRQNESPERDQSMSSSALTPPQEPADTGAPRSDSAPAAAAERAAASADSASPARWATLIETLYASGDRAAAAAQLRAFRIEHPDADRYLPEALREWASAVE